MAYIHSPVCIMIAILATVIVLAACPWAKTAEEQAAKYALPQGLMSALIAAESSCRADITGPGGARGLFQFEESTWRRYSKRPWQDAYDPQASIEAAINYHLELIGDNSIKNHVAWHNAGVKNWEKLSPKWSINHPNKIYRGIYRGK